MHLEIILIGIVVGIANFCSRYLPLHLIQRHQPKTKTGSKYKLLSIAMGSIGISAICAMLMVATMPPLIAAPDKIFASICGFALLMVIYVLTKRLIVATFMAALAYGLIYSYAPHFI